MKSEKVPKLRDAARRLADAEAAYRKVASAGDVLNQSPAWNEMRAAGDWLREVLAQSEGYSMAKPQETDQPEGNSPGVGGNFRIAGDAPVGQPVK